MNILIPMAGRGNRFLEKAGENPEYAGPKPLINIMGKKMIEWSISSLPLTEQDNLIFLLLKEHVAKHQIDEKLKKTFGNSIKAIIVDGVTAGAVCTALLAKEFIDNEEPLIITDSDHFIDGKTHFEEIKKHPEIDGMIPVFYATNPKWSYAKIDENGFVKKVAEKKAISNNANIGVYYFKKGSSFVKAAEKMIEKNDRVNNEFYIAPVYNYLIGNGDKILLSRPKFVYGLGTPEDVEIFIDLLKSKKIEHNFKDLSLNYIKKTL